MTGLYNAFQDSIPLIAITGQHLRAFQGKEGFQAMDITEVARTVTKKTYYVRDDRGAVTAELTVPADSSGAGTMTWTPPDRGIYSVIVRGNTADGTRSGGIGYSVYVN